MSSVPSVSSQSVQFPPRGPRPQHTMPPSGSGDGSARVQMNLSTLAEALGMDADALVQKLQAGEDLTSLLRDASSATGYGSSATVSGGLAVDRHA